MGHKPRFTVAQVIGIVAAILIVGVGTPATVLAASGGTFRLVDRTHPHRAAAVSASGAVKVAVSGTSPISVTVPAHSFSFSTYDANKLISTDPCGTKYAISSFSVVGNAGAGLDPVTVGTKGNELGDVLSLSSQNSQPAQLTFPQPFIVTPSKLPAGSRCKEVQLYEDGGAAQTLFAVVGYRIPPSR